MSEENPWLLRVIAPLSTLDRDEREEVVDEVVVVLVLVSLSTPSGESVLLIQPRSRNRSVSTYIQYTHITNQ